MKTRDLMRGDKLYETLLEDTPQVVTVEEVGQNHIYVGMEDDDMALFRYEPEHLGWNIKHIEPIPLTEEILKANGFWFGLLPDEQDVLSMGLGVSVDYEERWVFDNENSGTVAIQFPKDGNGGEIVICNDDKYFCYVWAEDTTTVNIHDLQHFLRDCKLYDLAEKLKIE